MNKYIIIILLVSPVINLFSINFSEPVNVEILNSSENEFSPVWNNQLEKLYYCSDKSGSEKFYTTDKNPDGVFRPSSYLSDRINSTSKNVSYLSFDKDKAYFSAFKKSSYQPISQIFYSDYEKQAWDIGFPLPELESKNFRGQPTISPDGNLMIFVSKDGDNDLDLFMTYKDPDGNWREPEIISGINSTGNELSPFLSSNDTLFFASDGQGGPGGFDLFYTVKEGGIWQRPNPVYNLNTEYNESDLTKLPDGSFIFSSDRPGGRGKLDLWITKSEKQNSLKNNKENVEVNLLSYTSKIIIRNEYIYTTLPISPILFLQSATDSLNTSLFDIYTEEEIQEFSNPLESYYATLAVIGSRMQRISDSRLKITVKLPNKIELNKSEKNSKFFADRNITKIIDYLGKVYSISPGRLSYSYDFYNKGSERPVIILESEESRLFDQIEIRSDNLDISQSKLIVETVIKPVDSYKKSAILRVGNRSVKLTDNFDSNVLKVNLSEYKELFFENQTFSIEVIAFSGDDSVASKDISFRIENARKSQPKKIVVDNKLYEVYRIFVGPDTDLNSEEYEATLNRIYSALALSKGISIEFDNSFEATNESVNTLESLISKRLVNDTQIEKSINSKSGINKNLIKIMIEKYPTSGNSSNN